MINHIMIRSVGNIAKHAWHRLYTRVIIARSQTITRPLAIRPHLS